MKAKCIKLAVNSDFESTALVRAALRGLCDYADIGGRALDSVELAVSEAVNNCVEHAYGNERGEEIVIECSIASGWLELVVIDRGRAMESDLLQRANRDMLSVDPEHPEGLRTSGRGLALIKESMDTVEYSSDGTYNRLVMTKRVADKIRNN